MNESMREAIILESCSSTNEDSRTSAIILGCICSLLSLLATVGNLASLIYVKLNWNVGSHKRKTNYTHQMTLVLVVNIAFTDLLNGLFSASFNAANLFRAEYPSPESTVMMYVCNVSGLVHFLTTRASILLMMCLSIFRYMAISQPTLFNTHRSIKVLWAVLGGVWAVSLAVSFLPYYLGTRYIYFSDVSHCTFHYWQLKDGLTDLCEFLRQGAQTLDNSFFFLLYILPIHGPGFTMIVFTLLILARLAKLHLKIQKGQGPRIKSKTWIMCCFRRSSEDSLHAKAANSTLQILAFFVLTYGPWWTISLIHYFDMHGLITSYCPRSNYWRCVLKSHFKTMLLVAMYLMVYLNAAINPFIYYYRLFKRSEALKKACTSRGLSAVVVNGAGMARTGSRDFLARDFPRGSSSPDQPRTPLMGPRGEQNGGAGSHLSVRGAAPHGAAPHGAAPHGAAPHGAVYCSTSC